MPDQFSKTLKSDMIEPITTSRVHPTLPVTGKIIGRKADITYEHPEEKHPPYSHFPKPNPELWVVLIEALDRFNEHQDFRHAPFILRLWGLNGGFRIQLIQEETGALVKQTNLIPFNKVTNADLDKMINALIGEEGIVIDLVR